MIKKFKSANLDQQNAQFSREAHLKNISWYYKYVIINISWYILKGSCHFSLVKYESEGKGL